SSRRRHTRFSRDWSSDVCSSDLFLGYGCVGERTWLAPRAHEEVDGLLTEAGVRFDRFTAAHVAGADGMPSLVERAWDLRALADRSEEHTSELQSRENLVCRLLLE